MHNTLVACGPDFRSGFIDELPTGNADLAPTILSILGIKPSTRMDGRVLSEAFITGKSPPAKPEEKTVKAQCDVGLRHWRQYLKFTVLDNHIYFDEGNGESVQR